MLVLRRKAGERVRVRFNGADVWVVVTYCRDGVARLGFEAPPDVEISREELIPPGEQPKGEAEPKQGG